MTNNQSQIEAALSVAGLSEYIQDLLESDRQLQQVWVTGEVSSAKAHRSGIFFTLSEPDGSAAIKCVVWQGQVSRLTQAPVPGEQLIVLGSIRLYSKRGDYQLTVWQALPAGKGLQALRYQQLKSRLQAEGLFAPQRKRPLPPHPQTLAVVTSPQAAAWGDIQRTLAQRYPGLRVLLSPATVQGEFAPASIVKAIARVERDGRAEVIILARGGGATEDLSCFNDERVVRAIAQSSIPVITGIGHQRDESLADLVADRSAHTPTAAAEQVVPQYAQLVTEHRQRLLRLKGAIQQRRDRETECLRQLKTRLQRLPATSRRLQQAEQRYQMLKEKLGALDPQAVLRRGYAVVRSSDGKLIKAANSVVPGQELTIQFGEGEITVQVLKRN